MNDRTVKSEFPSGSVETSERMQKIRSKGTRLERVMSEILQEMELKYFEQPKMTGHPDFKLKNHDIVIFCDSSFWHGRNPDDVSGKNFKRNRDLWVEKLTKTKQRDKKINRELRRHGFMVLRFWDDEILRYPDKVKKKIKSSLNVKL